MDFMKQKWNYKEKGFFATACIYHGSRRDFPQSERKPLWRMLYFYLTGRLRCHTLEDEQGIAAYAMLFAPRGSSDFVLLDYFAVDAARRGQGIGSEMLRRMTERIPAIVLEAENPAFAVDEEEQERMERRIRFYERAGFSVCPIEVKLFGVEFCILSSPERCTSDALRVIYDDMIPPAVQERMLEIRE